MAHAEPGESWPDERVAEFVDHIASAGADFRRLVERVPAVLYACELGEHGRWRYISPQVEEIFGYSPEEWMADPSLWARQLHPEDRERALEQETDKALGQGNAAPVDYRMFTRSGEVVWILDEAVLEPDEDGTPIWHGVLYDITDRKLAEHELRRAAAQQAAVARLGGHALQVGDPARLLDQAVALMTEIDGVEAACIWTGGGGGRSLWLSAGLAEHMAGAEGRAFAAADSHAGAVLESELHVIVDDWTTERRFSMPSA
ncbi:MAG TPA: PAS domain-containing protein, partial [Solirubrobacterales bacterium]|nr:PAS domain-containing protein [Solirubrobacterales bacterium]